MWELCERIEGMGSIWLISVSIVRGLILSKGERVLGKPLYFCLEQVRSELCAVESVQRNLVKS